MACEEDGGRPPGKLGAACADAAVAVAEDEATSAQARPSLIPRWAVAAAGT